MNLRTALPLIFYTLYLSNSFAQDSLKEPKPAEAVELSKGQVLMDALIGKWKSKDGKVVWEFTMQGCSRTKNGKKKTGKWFINLEDGYLEYEFKGRAIKKAPLGYVKIKGEQLTFRRLREYSYTRID